jgi:NO-binding membrane sensor protein with MHYT domain
MPFADDKSCMPVLLIKFDFRLVALSSFIVTIAMYATLALVERMKAAQGACWFVWLGGGASGMGIGIWTIHYLGVRTLGMSVPMLGCSSVFSSILATVFASGFTLLVVSGKSDSGRGANEESQRQFFVRSSTVPGRSDCF